MPARYKDKNNTLLVKFHDNVASQQAHSFLAWLGINGIKVSTLINRWAVEVPYWKEEEFLDKFYESELVLTVHDHFDKASIADGQEGQTEEAGE